MHGTNAFHLVIQDLAGLLAQLPPGPRWIMRQEILASLNRMAQLLANLEAEKAELERTVAVLEAQAIIAGKGGNE